MAESIWDVSDAELASAQGKITYLGDQSKPVPTIAFATTGHHLAMVRFLSIQRANTPYPNDETPYTKTFAVSREEFRSILSSVRPVLTSAAADGPTFLSFCVLTGAGDAVRGEEFFVSHAKGELFYNALLEALSRENTNAKAIILSQYRNVYP